MIKAASAFPTVCAVPTDELIMNFFPELKKLINDADVSALCTDNMKTFKTDLENVRASMDNPEKIGKATIIGS